MAGTGVVLRRPVQLIVLLGAAISLGAALAAQAGRMAPRIDFLAELAPVWLAAALVSAAAGVVIARGRMRVAIVWVGAAATLAAVVLMAPAFARPASARAAIKGAPMLKLIQFNTWDRNADIPGTADWIAREKPDLVLIEEAEPPISSALQARGFQRAQGIGHVAIFSRETPGPDTIPISLPRWHALPPFARAEFGAKGRRFAVFAVHLTRSTVAAAGPQEALFGLLDRYDRRRLILAGDFNLTSWSFVLRRWEHGMALERRDPVLFSWPDKLNFGGPVVPALPFLPIDHVYAGSDWRTVSIEAGPALGSDHLPVIVTLAWTPDANQR